MTERKILQKVKHPFLVGLDYVKLNSEKCNYFRLFKHPKNYFW